MFYYNLIDYKLLTLGINVYFKNYTAYSLESATYKQLRYLRFPLYNNILDH